MNANLAVESEPEPILMTTEITLDSLKAEFEDLKSNCHAMIESVALMASSITSKVECRLALLSENEKRWKDLQAKMEKNSATATKKIKLDIGGKMFSASKKTLMSKPSYFCGLLSSDFQPDGEDGSFFVDRNPIVFDRILDYLRTGKLEIRELSELHLEKLKDDFDYYSMDLPIELLPPPPPPPSWDQNTKPNFCTIKNNDMTVVRNIIEGWSGVLGNQAVDKYTVRIDNRGTGSIMVGFSTGVQWDPNGDNSNSNGWFLFLSRGTVFGVDTTQTPTPYTDEKFANGDYVTVIREGNSMRFLKNKVNLGICKKINNIPDQPLLPALVLGTIDATLTLISNY